MPSPFLGMDPYIEACRLWEDFHDNFIIDLQRQLAACLPDRYVARAGERSYVVLEPRDGDAEEYVAKPDVAVLVAQRRSGATGSTAVLESVSTEPPPVEMEALIEAEHRESFLEISQLEPKRKLVTTIELLSPSNKRPGSIGWIRYNRKRQAHLMGQANLVEIDLLRGGSRMPMFDPWPDSPYYALVYRKGRGVRCTVWPAHFMRPLPVVPVPLNPPDNDIPLAIQPLLEQIYDRSRYATDIDYHEPCRPRLSPDEIKWLAKRLRERKRKK